MRLWRLIRTGQTALDGAGTSKHGGRYSPPGAPVVNFASEAGLAVLVALRYLPGDLADRHAPVERLAARHGDRVVIENLIGDIHTGGD